MTDQLTQPVGGALDRMIMNKWLRRGATVFVLALSAYLAYRIAGAMGDEDELQQRVDDAGMFGPFAFFALMSLGIPIGIPGVLFVLAATYLWPPYVSFPLLLAGCMGKAAINFHFARLIGRKAIERRMPIEGRLRRWDNKLAAGAMWPVIVFRIMWYPARGGDWLLAVTSVKPRTYYLGTLIGCAVPTLSWVLLTDRLLGWGLGA